MLAIARYAAREGLRIDGFLIEDHALARVPDEVEAEVSAALLEVLISDGVGAAAALIDDDYGFYVTGVKLTGPDLRSFTLLREGVTRAQPETHIEEFLIDAWTAVHFS